MHVFLLIQSSHVGNTEQENNENLEARVRSIVGGEYSMGVNEHTKDGLPRYARTSLLTFSRQDCPCAVLIHPPTQ